MTDGRLHVAGELDNVHSKLQDAMYEIKRVIVGQDQMLERVMVCLLGNGHLLLEGVPGLAKTLTIRTLAGVLGGKFQRVQFTPDLVPSDLVGTRIYRADKHTFDTELGPIFCNFLLADEINRAPAKVQSALLEVMQEQQVTIGPKSYKLDSPFLVMATQNPIESEGTYPLPEAQMDRFMMKVVVDYPSFGDEMEVVGRSLADPVEVKEVVSGSRGRRVPEVGRVGVRRSSRLRVRGRADDGDAQPGGVRARRAPRVHQLRRKPARLDQPRQVGARTGADTWTSLRAPIRRKRTRQGRPASPNRAQLRGPRIRR